MARPVSYHTGKFPPSKLDWERLIPLIGPANGALARYDGLLSAIPNADVLLSPLTTQEAVLSSRIEGTQATMGEVLEYEAGGSSEMLDPKKVDDVHEKSSTTTAPCTRPWINSTSFRSVSASSSKFMLHCSTMCAATTSCRGQYKPVPNFIGRIGCTLEQARFVPIARSTLTRG